MLDLMKGENVIQEVAEDVTFDVTFYKALAQVVEQARLKDPRLEVQREIIRRANAHLVELRTTEQDPFKRAVWKMLDFLAPSTLTNVLQWKDKPSYFTLCRIGWGLGLSDETIEWLASLLEEEQPRHHTTTQKRIAIVKEETMKGGEKLSTSEEENVPSWVLQRPC